MIIVRGLEASASLGLLVLQWSSKNRYNGHLQQPFSSLGIPKSVDCRAFVRPSCPHDSELTINLPLACIHRPGSPVGPQMRSGEIV